MRADLYSIQPPPAGTLSIMARPRGGDWLLDEIKALHDANVDVLISLLTADEVLELDLREEAQNCHDQGIVYLSFPIIDRHVPPFTANTVAFLEQIKTLLLDEKHVALHCRMGLGVYRSSPQVCWCSWANPLLKPSTCLQPDVATPSPTPRSNVHGWRLCTITPLFPDSTKDAILPVSAPLLRAVFVQGRQWSMKNIRILQEIKDHPKKNRALPS